MSEQRLDPSRIGVRIEDLIINGAPYRPSENTQAKRSNPTTPKATADPLAPVKLPKT